MTIPLFLIGELWIAFICISHLLSFSAQLHHLTFQRERTILGRSFSGAQLITSKTSLMEIFCSIEPGWNQKPLRRYNVYPHYVFYCPGENDDHVWPLVMSMLCLLASDITLPHSSPLWPPTPPPPPGLRVMRWFGADIDPALHEYWSARGVQHFEQTRGEKKPVEQDGIIKQILRKMELLFRWMCAGDPEWSGMRLNDLVVLSNMKVYNSN